MSIKSKPYIIVLGNEKGGTGKSTIAMNLISYFLYYGYQVGSIDTDSNQGTLTRYLENRSYYIKYRKQNLPVPNHILIQDLDPESLQDQKNSKEEFIKSLDSLKRSDFIIIDTPGFDTNLSRLAHSYANTLITPLNDSFIDLDILIKMNTDSFDSLKLSSYSETVWEQKKNKVLRDGRSIDWVVLRNRSSHIKSKNKEEIERVLNALSKRIGFRHGPGFSDRVIYKELFLVGLTVFDLKYIGINLTQSHVIAYQELTNLVNSITSSNLFQKESIEFLKS